MKHCRRSSRLPYRRCRISICARQRIPVSVNRNLNQRFRDCAQPRWRFGGIADVITLKLHALEHGGQGYALPAHPKTPGMLHAEKALRRATGTPHLAEE